MTQTISYILEINTLKILCLLEYVCAKKYYLVSSK